MDSEAILFGIHTNTHQAPDTTLLRFLSHETTLKMHSRRGNPSDRNLSRGKIALPITEAYESSPWETFAQFAKGTGPNSSVCNLSPS